MDIFRFSYLNKIIKYTSCPLLIVQPPPSTGIAVTNVIPVTFLGIHLILWVMDSWWEVVWWQDIL